MRITAILEVCDAPELDGQPCMCLCRAQHGEHNMGVCEGYLGTDGVRVFHNSMWTTERGVPVCRSCINVYQNQG